ncbi:EAL domain-containing protein [Ancylothrix sp. C2]|uniref:EAL domain-containing protein n=1 Tax=Ancylothrix sp. D3o TaxID=2953691 RepID=UPI0021BA77BB|nr:EAL domain-containing protein [Ancylothrix sp. D3o]MCT7952069.1 EAL domain-containing protein [Ancylothrix sp. D3o]
MLRSTDDFKYEPTISGKQPPQVRDIVPKSAKTPKKSPEIDVAESTLCQAVDLMPVAAVVARVAGGEILYANELFSQSFGLSSEKSIEYRQSDFYGDPAEYERLLATFPHNKVISNYPLKVKKIDGTLFSVSLSIRRVTFNDEPAILSSFCEVAGATSYNTNYAQNGHTQTETVANLIDKLQITLDAVPGIVSWIDSDLHYIKVNRHLADLFGLHPNDFVGKDIGFLGGSPDFKMFMGKFFAGNATEAMQEFPTKIGGQIHSCLIIAKKYNQGQAAFIVGIDITERKEAEAALRESEAKLKALLNSSLQSVLLIDRQRKIQAFNETANDGAKLFFDKFLREGALIDEYISREDLKRFNLDFQKAIKGGFVKTEIRIERTDQEHWFEINYNPVFDEKGQVTGVYFSAINIDARKKAIEALARSEERFRSLVQNSSDIITILETDATIRYQSPSIQRILGYEPKELIGKQALDYVHPEDKKAIEELFSEAIKRPGKVVKVEFRFRHASGDWVFLEAIGANRLEDQAIGGFVVNSRDISKRKRSEEKLRLFERALHSSINAIAITDTQAPDNPVVYVNPAFESMTGYSEQEVVGQNLRFLQGPEIEQPSLRKLRKALIEGTECKVILRNYHKNGRMFWNELYVSPVHNQKGILTHYIGVQSDISERKIAEEKLIHHAFYDALTGLPNRAFFTEQLTRAMIRTQRHPNYLCAVLFLDLDRFKVVNDSLGHSAGDSVLTEIAHRLEKCLTQCQLAPLSNSEVQAPNFVPPNVFVARLGGDHFVILLEGIRNIHHSTHIAEEIHKLFLQPFHINGHEVYISTSIGIALSSSSYDGKPDLLRDADIAMYHAKAQGKARSALFDKFMHDQAVVRLQLENDLRRAIEREEFLLHYQPIVCLKTGKISGFEALVRWQHPERGMISPAEFIPIAEETGLILPLGAWVLREACRQMKEWEKSIPLTISVNLSAKQFLQRDFVEQVDKILLETSFNSQFLKLELTETALIENTELTTDILCQLRQRNIQLSLDDFGMGYSSLSYLHRFPINTLKIDRSFVSRTGAADKNTQIVRAIVNLAHSLAMDVVAEGAETAENLALLRALGCEYGQGYYFSKPLPVEAAFALLTSSAQW